MSFLTITNVKIAGMGACVPSLVEENLTLPIFENQCEARKVIASTGIERRRVVEPGTTASDLTCQAVDKLLAELWISCLPSWIGMPEVLMLWCMCVSAVTILLLLLLLFFRIVWDFVRTVIVSIFLWDVRDGFTE